MMGSAAAAAHAGAPDQRQAPPPGSSEPPAAYEPRLPVADGQRLPSPSELDEVMRELPIIDYKTTDADERARGFSFGLKPGKGVKAIARLRF